MNVKEESGKAGLKLNILKTKIMTSSPNTSRQKMGGKCEKRDRFHFIGLQNYCRSLKSRLSLLGKSYDKARQHIIIQRHHFADKGLSSQSCGFCSHVQMWESPHKEGWMPKNWCFQTVVLEKTLESPLDSKEIQPSVEYFSVI